jgi:CheY-like chemotaxis protein
MALITFLVEDNKTIRDNLVPALEDLVNGRVVGFAETETEALAWLADHPNDWQLLIVDLSSRKAPALACLPAARRARPCSGWWCSATM